MVKAYDLFHVWSPDTVAECMDGVGNGLYSLLWNLVDDNKKPNGCGDDSSDFCLAKYWDKLSEEDQLELNSLAEKYEAEMSKMGRADEDVF